MKLIKLFGVVILMFFTSMAWAGKQSVCHIPPGNPENFHTITVNDNAVSAHLANHGDFVGSCQENCEAACDDGNACTIDVASDTDQCDCATEPRDQVDCSDGNSCTADSCDPADGTCVNDPGPVNGDSCDDDNSNTSGEVCDNGSCDPVCPCFTGGDLLANGAVSSCGSSDPLRPDVTYMFWENGGTACSGDLCAYDGLLTCGINTGPTPNSQFVTDQQDQNCRVLILNYCTDPDPTTSLSLSVTAGDSSVAPLIGN